MIVTDAVATYLDRIRAAPDPVLADMEAQGAPRRDPDRRAEHGSAAADLGPRPRCSPGGRGGNRDRGLDALHRRGLAPGGTIVSFEIDPERQAAARGYLERAGVLDQADLRLQDAREGLTELDGEYDFAFLDGVKSEYEEYFERLLPHLAPGAVVVVDNVLMGGSVAEDDPSERPATARAFNDHVLSHPELTGTVTPVGDGVLVAVKTGPRS